MPGGICDADRTQIFMVVMIKYDEFLRGFGLESASDRQIIGVLADWTLCRICVKNHSPINKKMPALLRGISIIYPDKD